MGKKPLGSLKKEEYLFSIVVALSCTILGRGIGYEISAASGRESRESRGESLGEQPQRSRGHWERSQAVLVVVPGLADHSAHNAHKRVPKEERHSTYHMSSAMRCDGDMMMMMSG